MKTFLISVFVLMCMPVASQSNFNFPALIVEYDSAIFFGHLKIIPVKRKETGNIAINDTVSAFLTLQSGMQKGMVAIKERGNYVIDNINVLLIKNNSNKNLILKSGELLTGGRQDRVLAKDTILPPGKQEYQIPVFCVEETRWSKRAKKFEYGGTVSSGMQNLIDSAHNQITLWHEIRNLLNANNQPTSLSYATILNQKKFADTTEWYTRYLLKEFEKKDSSIVGIIASTGNKVLGADVFMNTRLFYQTLAALLNKYSAEAQLYGTAPTKQHQHETNYANDIFSPATQNNFLIKKGKRIYYKGTLIQISGYSIHY